MNTSSFTHYFRIVLLIAFSAVLFNCGDDEEVTNASANNDLSGAWEATSFVVVGVETIGTINTGLRLTFTPSPTNDEEGTFQGTPTDINGVVGAATASTYTVLEEGTRIRIGADTLDMSVSSSSLNLDGFVLQAESTIVATKL